MPQTRLHTYCDHRSSTSASSILTTRKTLSTIIQLLVTTHVQEANQAGFGPSVTVYCFSTTAYRTLRLCYQLKSFRYMSSGKSSPMADSPDTEKDLLPQHSGQKWRSFFGRDSLANQNESEKAEARPTKWSMGVLNDRQTHEVPGMYLALSHPL